MEVYKVARIKPNLKVMKWLPLAEKWSRQGITPVPVALILAIIQMESAGNPNAKRAEPEALAGAIRDRRDEKINMIAKITGLDPIEIMSSYGLMQLLVTTAWGYLSARHKGPDVTETLCSPDQNIRLGVSHLATLLKKRDGDIRLAARDYNGQGPMAEAYGRNAQDLYLQFKKILEDRE